MELIKGVIYMLKAKSDAGEVVMLSNLPRNKIIQLRKNATFYCPECKEKVIIKAGTKVVAHFAHQVKSNCAYGGEGEYHEQGKYILYQWLASQNIPVELEVYLPEIKQRPDILVTLHGKRIAVEFQCAKVSNQIIRQRNIGYKKANVIPIWILGQTLLHRFNQHTFKINRFTLQFLHQFSSTSTATLFYFCPQSKSFNGIYDIHITGNKQAIGKFIEKSIYNLSFKDLFLKNDFTKQDVINQWYRQLNFFRLKERGKVFGRHLEWRTWLYEQGIYIDGLPSLFLIPVRSQYLFKISTYDWQSRILIDFLRHLEIGECFSFTTVRMMFKGLEVNGRMYPMLRSDSHPIYEYLECLTLFGVIAKSNDQEFQVIKPIQIYASIEDALVGDEQIFEDVNKKVENINAKQRMKW